MRTLSSSIMGDLRAIFEDGGSSNLSDGYLLDRFLSRRDEAAELAFAALVTRHGPMVMRVCRGILENSHDAEDAFQATFLVLARKAAVIRKRDSLASFLHGIALRAARDIQAAAIRRKKHEGLAASRQPASERRTELVRAVHEEVARLAEPYRTPIVLCELEGLTCEEAAQRLGCPVGTIKSRLSRGRDRLRVRLSRRGLSSEATFGLAAIVPATLADSTARIARPFTRGTTSAAIAEGIVRAMAVGKFRAVAAAWLVAGTALAIGVSLALENSQGAPKAPSGAAASPAEDRRGPKSTPARMSRHVYSVDGVDPVLGVLDVQITGGMERLIGRLRFDIARDVEVISDDEIKLAQLRPGRQVRLWVDVTGLAKVAGSNGNNRLGVVRRIELLEEERRPRNSPEAKPQTLDDLVQILLKGTLEERGREHRMEDPDQQADGEFLHRIYLGLTGGPPTANEVVKFLIADDRTKRSDTINKLLGDPANWKRGVVESSSEKRTLPDAGPKLAEKTVRFLKRDAIVETVDARAKVAIVKLAEPQGGRMTVPFALLNPGEDTSVHTLLPKQGERAKLAVLRVKDHIFVTGIALIEE